MVWKGSQKYIWLLQKEQSKEAQEYNLADWAVFALSNSGRTAEVIGLFTKLKEANLLKSPPRTPAEVLVTTMDHQYLDKYLRMATALRAAGINTEVYLETAKIGNQLAYADRKGFRLALVAGENEFSKNTVQVKHLASKTARDVPIEGLVAAVRESLAR